MMSQAMASLAAASQGKAVDAGEHRNGQLLHLGAHYAWALSANLSGRQGIGLRQGSLMSAPAMKARPWPVISKTRISGFLAT